MNNPDKTPLDSAPVQNEKRKSILTSTLAGAAFGLVVGIVFVQMGISDLSPVPFVGGLSLLTATFSGLSGYFGYLLDERLKKRGMSSPLIRTAVVFLAMVILTFSAATILLYTIGSKDISWAAMQYGYIGMFLGLIFGLVVVIINYRMETVQQRLRLLEIENRFLAELTEKDQLLQEAARNLTVAEERNLMARELHDSISQGIHGIVFSLHSLRRQLDNNPKAGEIISHLEETTQATLQELRRMIMELTPSPLEDNSLTDALRLHCDLFTRRQQIKTTLDQDYTGNLTPEQEVAAYRIIQEALANIQKHAGAKAVAIRLTSDEKKTTLCICDDGRGFDPIHVKTGNGLANMATRARQNNGEFHLDTAEGKGTTITVSFFTAPF